MNSYLKRTTKTRRYNSAKRSLTPLLVCLSLCIGAAHSVTCQNNLLPSNPDVVYVINNNGTVTDNRTGLMWKVCGEGQTWSAGACIGTAGTFTWAPAIAQAEASSFASYSDWRLPNLKELRSLVEECRTNVSINDVVFPSTASNNFWSASPYTGVSAGAWVVSFSTGYSNLSNRNASYYVRLVRGGQ